MSTYCFHGHTNMYIWGGKKSICGIHWSDAKRLTPWKGTRLRTFMVQSGRELLDNPNEMAQLCSPCLEPQAAWESPKESGVACGLGWLTAGSNLESMEENVLSVPHLPHGGVRLPSPRHCPPHLPILCLFIHRQWAWRSNLWVTAPESGRLNKYQSLNLNEWRSEDRFPVVNMHPTRASWSLLCARHPVQRQKSK